eukprot:366244-Chlamydomonas_euryale.AAC.3
MFSATPTLSTNAMRHPPPSLPSIVRTACPTGADSVCVMPGCGSSGQARAAACAVRGRSALTSRACRSGRTWSREAWQVRWFGKRHAGLLNGIPQCIFIARQIPWFAVPVKANLCLVAHVQEGAAQHKAGRHALTAATVGLGNSTAQTRQVHAAGTVRPGNGAAQTRQAHAAGTVRPGNGAAQTRQAHAAGTVRPGNGAAQTRQAHAAGTVRPGNGAAQTRQAHAAGTVRPVNGAAQTRQEHASGTVRPGNGPAQTRQHRKRACQDQSLPAAPSPAAGSDRCRARGRSGSER